MGDIAHFITSFLLFEKPIIRALGKLGVAKSMEAFSSHFASVKNISPWSFFVGSSTIFCARFSGKVGFKNVSDMIFETSIRALLKIGWVNQQCISRSPNTNDQISRHCIGYQDFQEP